MSYRPEFARLVEEALTRLDRSPAWLAQRLGVNQSTVSRWLNQGARPRDPETVVHIADILGMTAQRQALLSAAGFAYAPDRSAPRHLSELAFPLHNLPVEQTPFIGRAAQLARIGQRLDDQDCRLVTIVGGGGIGKTRLAIRAAQEQAGCFADGVCFIDLAPVSAPALLASTVLRALNAPESGARDAAQRLSDYLRGRELLLVLDNFEHLMDGVELLPRLIKAAPGLKLLVTSRERLNLVEEWLEPVEGMEVPPGDAPGAVDDCCAAMPDLNAYDATRLFLACMRRVRPGYEASQEDAQAIEAICRLLEGMPLAIELAAAWTRTLPPGAVLRETQRSLEFLSTSLRDMPERHRSINAVFDHSWSMLSERERSILRQFSVFRGGCTREAMEVVTGATLAEAVELADKSWLRADATGRYTVHELVRQYCVEKLEVEQSPGTGGVPSSVATRHLHFYSAYLSRKLGDSNYVPTVAGEIEAELGNLMQALQSAITQFDMHSVLNLCWCLWFVGDLSGRQRFSIQSMESVVPLIEELLAHPSTGEALRTEAAHALCGILCAQRDQYQQLGMLDETMDCAQRVASLARGMQAGRRRTYWTALGQSGLAGAAREAGDYHVSRRMWLEALELVKADEFECFLYAGERRKFWQIQIYHNLAGIAWTLGDYEEAASSLERSISLCDELGEKRSKGQHLAIHSRVAQTIGEYERAAEEAQAGLKLSEACGDRQGIAVGHCALGCVLAAKGCYDLARQHLLSSLEIGRKSGRLDIVTRPLIALGNVALAIGDPDEARNRFGEALSVFERTGATHNNVLPQVWIGLAFVALADGKLVDARRLFKTALNSSGRTAVDTMRAIAGIAEVKFQEGDIGCAASLLNVVAKHPHTDHVTRTQVRMRIEELERACGPELRAAWSGTGEVRELDEVIAGLTTCSAVGAQETGAT